MSEIDRYNNEFLKARHKKEMPCSEEYDNYKECVDKHLKKENLMHIRDVKFSKK